MNTLYVVKGNHIKKVDKGIKNTSLFEDNQTYFNKSGNDYSDDKNKIKNLNVPMADKISFDISQEEVKTSHTFNKK